MKRKDLHILCLLFTGFALGNMSSFAQSQWQQELSYKIDVSLDASKKQIKGDIEISYKNNSPDTLKEIYIHLWPNAFQPGTAWSKQVLKLNMLDFHYDNRYGNIDSLNFTVNGDNVVMAADEATPDIARLILTNPIAPGATAIIASPFKTQLPYIFSRGGYSTKFIAATQWYPKPAVYDSVGWHPMPYLEQGEFYSEFGTFDVKINLPASYYLAATGLTIDTLQIDTTKGARKTVQIHQENIHDFAWFASPIMKVMMDSVTLTSGKKVLTQVFYKDVELAEKAMEFQKEALILMSDWVGEYPNSVSTVVQGPAGMGGGMEYPTICTVTGEVLAEETVHEIAHNWWYGILANNERDHPWLDESVTSYYETRMMQEIGESAFDLSAISSRKISRFLGLEHLPENPLTKYAVLMQQRLNQQQAMTTSSVDYSVINYYLMLYAKGPVAFQWLEKALGTEVFDNAMKQFYTEYAFKHFTAENLQLVFEKVSGQPLDWFFKEVVSSKNHDFKLKNVQKMGDSLMVTITSNFENAIPVPLAFVDNNQSAKDVTWITVQPGTSTYTISASDDFSLVIDPNWNTFDQNRSNNYFKLNKAFPKTEKFSFKFLAGIEDPSRNQLFYTPVLGGNAYDGFQLGLALYNRVFPAKNLDMELVPMFAFRSKKFNWISNISYHFQPQNQKPIDIELGVHSKSFSMNDFIEPTKFYKVQPFVRLTFDKTKGDKRPVQMLTYRFVSIWEESYDFLERDTINEINIFAKNTERFCTHEIRYDVRYQHALYPFNAATRLEFNKNFVKQSFEWAQKFRYSKKGSFVSMRMFAGAFYFKNQDVSFRQNRRWGYNLSGISGRNDYLYDYFYMGRNENEGFYSKQIAMGEGNFKVITPLNSIGEGQTVNALIAANVKIDFPIKKVPVKLFADFAYSIDKELNIENVLPVKQFHYDLGLCLSVFNEGIEVYFPLLMSQNFKDYYKANLPKFGQRITFMVDMSKLNFHRNSRDFDFMNMSLF